jgi:hypothetical protein
MCSGVKTQKRIHVFFKTSKHKNGINMYHMLWYTECWTLSRNISDLYMILKVHTHELPTQNSPVAVSKVYCLLWGSNWVYIYIYTIEAVLCATVSACTNVAVLGCVICECL